MSPEIRLVNQTRWRLGLAAQRLGEVVALLREAAAAPDYAGPPLAGIEQIDDALAEFRKQIQTWQLDANIRYTAGLSRNVRRGGNGRLRRGWPSAI